MLLQSEHEIKLCRMSKIFVQIFLRMVEIREILEIKDPQKFSTIRYYVELCLTLMCKMTTLKDGYYMLN